MFTEYADTNKNLGYGTLERNDMDCQYQFWDHRKFNLADFDFDNWIAIFIKFTYNF